MDPSDVRLLISLLLLLMTAAAEEPAPPTVSVCEVLRNAAAYAGRTVLVVGRYSFRERGRYLSEQGCAAAGTAVQAWRDTLKVVLDSKSGPKPPAKLGVDSSVLEKMLSELKKSTKLATFRFGSDEYDRWGIVYGRIEWSPDYPAGAPQTAPAKGEFDPSPGRLVCRGDALVMIIPDR